MRGHPNIVQYYSAWAEQEGGPVEALVIQLELCEGSLRELLKARGGPLKEAELLALMKQVRVGGEGGGAGGRGLCLQHSM